MKLTQKNKKKKVQQTLIKAAKIGSRYGIRQNVHTQATTGARRRYSISTNVNKASEISRS